MEYYYLTMFCVNSKLLNISTIAIWAGYMCVCVCVCVCVCLCVCVCVFYAL